MALVQRTRYRHPETRLTDEQRDLAARYMPIANSISRRLARRWPAYKDEMRVAAEDALIYAARLYDSGRGVKFSTYAYLVIRRRCWDRLRVLWRLSKRMRGPFGSRPDTRIYVQGDDDFCQSGHPTSVIDCHDFIQDIDGHDAFECILASMPEMTARILTLVCLYDCTYGEAADLVGISTTAAYYRVARARRYLTGRS